MPCGLGLLARSRGQANLPKRLKSHMRSILPGHLGLAFKIGQPADLPIGSLAPRDVGDLGREEIGSCFPCRLREFATFAILADRAPDRQGPVVAPERLEQTGGGSEPRIERFVDPMFFENADRDVSGSW